MLNGRFCENKGILCCLAERKEKYPWKQVFRGAGK